MSPVGLVMAHILVAALNPAALSSLRSAPGLVRTPGLVPVSSRAGAISLSGGKGFGGGEATRDPAPTYVDPNDPKGKQQAIHKAESFQEYLARRGGGSVKIARK